MRTSRVSHNQIMDELKRAKPVSLAPNLQKEPGISTVIFYKCYTKFGGVDAWVIS